MKKNVLFVINSLQCGGAEKSLVTLLSCFDCERYSVDLQMLIPGGMFMELLPENVKVLPEIPYLKYCREGGFSPKFALSRLIASVGLRFRPRINQREISDAQSQWKFTSKCFGRNPKKYDVAIAWGQDNPTHYVAEKISADKKIAFVNTDYEKSNRNPDFDRPYYGKFDKTVTVSDSLRDIMCRVFPEYADKTATVYDIRDEKFNERMANGFNPYENDKAVKIVTVGRMTKPKGYDLAVDAAKILRRSGMDFHWYFVGNGEEAENIRRQIDEAGLGECVIPVGEKANPYPYMKNADIYVQTSRNEGYCLTLSEARALRVPDVTTDFEVVRNQITDGENGLIVPICAEGIAEGIIRLWNDRELYERIRERLSSEKVGNYEEIEKLYGIMEE